MIRPYLPTDRAAVRLVCLRTGAAGADATGATLDDDLVADAFALPYLEFAAELAFVVDHEEYAAGYVVGVTDTSRFVEWYRAIWLPRLAVKYARLMPAASADPLVARVFAPERMLPPRLDEYPAHLHINLLPAVQGQGIGRELIERECAALRAAGAVGVHLGVSPSNAGALAFYPRVGFHEFARDADAVLFGRRLA